MSDPRLNSCHLEFPRRQDYRRCREAVLQGRGWLTMAGENLGGMMGDSEDWPLRPERVLPGTRYLLVDQQEGCVHPLKIGLNAVGRYSENDIQFLDLVISRRHCVLVVHAWGGCDLHDTASRNGTFVNGTRVQQMVRLESGDQVQLCNRRLLFVSEKDYLDDGLGDPTHPPTMAE
jgi:hypothetical protein